MRTTLCPRQLVHFHDFKKSSSPFWSVYGIYKTKPNIAEIENKAGNM